MEWRGASVARSAGPGRHGTVAQLPLAPCGRGARCGGAGGQWPGTRGSPSPPRRHSCAGWGCCPADRRLSQNGCSWHHSPSSLAISDSSSLLLPVLETSRGRNADPNYRKHSWKVTPSNINLREMVMNPSTSFTCSEIRVSSAETYVQNPAKRKRGERYSRSGRRLIPPLQYWCGERQVWDQAMIVRIEEGGKNYLAERMVSKSKRTSSKTCCHALVKRKKTTELKERTGCCNLGASVRSGVNVPSLTYTNLCSTEDTVCLPIYLPNKQCKQESQDKKTYQKVVSGDVTSPNIVKEDFDPSTSSQEPVHSGEISRRTYSTGDKKLFSSGNQDLSEQQSKKYMEKTEQERNSQMRSILEKLDIVVEGQREMQNTLSKVHLCLEQNRKIATSLLGMPERS